MDCQKDSGHCGGPIGGSAIQIGLSGTDASPSKLGRCGAATAGARRKLAELWPAIAGLSRLNPLAQAGLVLEANPLLLDMIGAQRRIAYNVMSMVTPYECNPVDHQVMSRVPAP